MCEKASISICIPRRRLEIQSIYASGAVTLSIDPLCLNQLMPHFCFIFLHFRRRRLLETTAWLGPSPSRQSSRGRSACSSGTLWSGPPFPACCLCGSAWSSSWPSAPPSMLPPSKSVRNPIHSIPLYYCNYDATLIAGPLSPSEVNKAVSYSARLHSTYERYVS